MDIKVPLTKGFLPDKYAKHTAPANIANGSPIISFPIQITGVPKEAKSLALTLIDWDAVPVS